MTNFNQTLDQHHDSLLNTNMAQHEAGCDWMEAVVNEVDLKLTDLEDTRIFDFATESMYDESPYAVGQRITKETIQFRAWHKAIKAKRPETTEEQAMDQFEYFDPDEFVITDREMKVFIEEAIEEMAA